jgi:hypothetical protein
MFLMDWHNESVAVPTAAATRTYDKGYHLRTPFLPDSKGGVGSLGHLTRDNYEPIVNAELRLGVNPREFTWVIVPLYSPEGAKNPKAEAERNSVEVPEHLSIVQRYSPWFMDKATVMWRKMFPDPGAPT